MELLEKITISKKVYEAEQIVCHVTGKPFPDTKTTVYYRHKETGREYVSVIGVFAIPGFEAPGFGLVLGYDRNKNSLGTNIIHAIDEYECRKRDLSSVIDGIVELRQKYSLPSILNAWYMEANENTMHKLTDLIVKRNQNFYFIGGPYYGKASSVRDYLKTFSEHTSVLERGNCNRLKGYIAMGPHTHEEAVAFRPEKNPALMAVSVGITELLIDKPWTWSSQPPPMHFNTTRTHGRYINLEDDL